MSNDGGAKEVQPQSERIISIGEVFSPFDAQTNNMENTRQRPLIGRDSGLFMRTTLVIDEDLSIPISISAVDMEERGIAIKKKDVLTPFDPDLGYPVDSEDFILEERKSKLARLEQEIKKKIDLAKAPLGLQIESVDKEGRLKIFSPEISKQLKKLRVLVRAGDMRLEAEPSVSIDLEDGRLGFFFFYPVDTGPLADSLFPLTSGEKPPYPGPLWVNLPKDPEKLKQIKMQFILAEDRNPISRKATH